MRVNRYPGHCAYCGNRVQANAGVLLQVSGVWMPAHMECEMHQAPQVNSYYSPVTGFYGIQNARGRCEDAPCCGCCTM